MKAVGAGTGDHVDDRGAGKTVLRAEVRLLHFEFFDRLRRWSIGDLCDTPVGFVVGNGGAIHQNVGAGAAAAVGNKIRPRIRDAVRVTHIGHSGCEVHQVKRIPAHQRQVVDGPAVDHRAGHGILGGDGLGLGFDVNALRRAGNLQRKVGGRILGDVQSDASADGFLKPFHLRRHGIESRRNRNKKIAPSVV